MNKIFLITRPRYDETTHYLFYWSKKIVELAKRKGIQTLDLQKERANKKEFVSIIAKKQPLLCFFNGHGDANLILGHQNEILVKANENEELLKGKIIYALSCKSAKVLGIKSVKKGTVAYIGYNDDFVFLYDETKISRPLDDNDAKLFLEPSNQIAVGLLKGHRTGFAYQKSQELFRKNIQELLTNESSIDSMYIRYLWWDMRHQVCLGDKETVF